MFTDREPPQQLFEEARADLAPEQYRILKFYGVGGLQQREQWEILDNLPKFLGWDLRAHRQGKNALQPIIL